MFNEKRKSSIALVVDFLNKNFLDPANLVSRVAAVVAVHNKVYTYSSFFEQQIS